ncbi:MAG: holo-ACP synthase [Acidimicrobiaceae bacterium]|nr:holo-ACP synthase [Acidimicrobiaceae bacterium]MCY4281067.1 holo-ACP synthase [Acidimicrobiaceae bacterium]
MTAPNRSIVQALESLNSEFACVAGVGVDLVNVDTLKRLLASNLSPFLDMAWTSVEQRDAADDPERLAARWAAKEAVMKSLGRGLGDVDPLDVEILHDHGGRPIARLHGAAASTAEQAGVEDIYISMAHEDGWAIAFAVVSLLSENSS